MRTTRVQTLEKPYSSLDIIKVEQFLPAFIQLSGQCCVRAALRQTDKFMYDDFIASQLSRSTIFYHSSLRTNWRVSGDRTAILNLRRIETENMTKPFDGKLFSPAKYLRSFGKLVIVS